LPSDYLDVSGSRLEPLRVSRQDEEQMVHPQRRMTRKQLAEFLRQNGHPYGDSTLDKLCMPSVNQGPPIDPWLGRRPLYEPSAGLAWAETRLRPEKPTRMPRRGQS